jgi:hypothetical protein
MKTVIISLVSGLAFALPIAASAQSDNEAALAASARYCRTLVQTYGALHQGETLPDGMLNQAKFCESDPQGAINNITLQMNEEHIPVPQP